MKIPLPIGAAVMAIVAMGVAMPLHAGGSWFSKVREIPAETRGDGRVVRALDADADSTQSVFDIVVSLESNPTGDDDATQDSGTGDDAQNLFENAIGEFADALCQQTNTAHKLGVVRIFRNFDEVDRADVRYEAQCELYKGPRASFNGFGRDGKLIYMCEIWDILPIINNAEASGTVLAHEWGHYAYGLLDEYRGYWPPESVIWQPRRADTPTSPSVMNTQWCAVPGFIFRCPRGFVNPDPDFLEFSTSRVAPFDGSGGSNAQFRTYGQSGWDTLVADTRDDPKLHDSIPPRVRYTNLEAVQPPVDGDYTVNDDESDCRSELDIQWQAPGLDIALDVLIDRSGSMANVDPGSVNPPIENAKQAMNVLISVQPEGRSAIGISSFSTTAEDRFPITPIPDPDTEVKDEARTAVSGISAIGASALFDGLMSSLDKLTQLSHASSRKVVFVLADGGDNSSEATQSEVTTAYQDANVPIFAFGYGSGDHNDVLSALAADTGGRFFFSPTGLSEIQEAFLIANTEVSNQAVVGNTSVPTSASQTVTETTVTVDDTLSSLQLALSYPGAVGDVTLALLDPSGQDTGVTFSCTATGSAVTCLGTLASIAARGDYRLRITSAVAQDIDVSLIVTGEPITGETYDVAVSINDGEDVTYPEPMVIAATVRHETAIAGLVVSAEVLDSSGSRIETIDLLDDGQDVDAIRDDGTYTGVFDYTENGQFTVRVHVDNSAMTGTTTTLGELAAVLPDGSAQDPTEARRPIGTAFTRSAGASVNVNGFRTDDHPDAPPGCTVIDADNSDVRGRIDHPGDVDCFRFTPSGVGSDLMVRSTGQIAGMDSVVTVLASDGTTVIRSGGASTSENPQSGVVVRVPATDIDATDMVVTVAHRDATADQGSYAVSAGSAIASDMPPPVPGQPATPRRSGGGGGSAVGPWTLGLAALLGIVGLFARRRRRT